MKTQGERLQALCQAATRELVLVAPFMKSEALRRLFSVVDPAVDVLCVTRWRPEDVVAGVSDLRVLEVAKERPRMQLFVRGDLHAKYYRSDEMVLVGSANVTATALGWSRMPNLELLVSVGRASDDVADFEERLLRSAVAGTEELAEAVRAAVEDLRATRDESSATEKEAPKGEVYPDSIAPGDPRGWLPACRSPERLYLAYRGDSSRFTEDNYRAARVDLEALGVPRQLTREAFDRYVRAVLAQTKFVCAVERTVSAAKPDEYMRRLLADTAQSEMTEIDIAESWDVLKRWLLYFFPGHYQVSTTEVIMKR